MWNERGMGGKKEGTWVKEIKRMAGKRKRRLKTLSLVFGECDDRSRHFIPVTRTSAPSTLILILSPSLSLSFTPKGQKEIKRVQEESAGH